MGDFVNTFLDGGDFIDGIKAYRGFFLYMRTWYGLSFCYSGAFWSFGWRVVSMGIAKELLSVGSHGRSTGNRSFVIITYTVCPQQLSHYLTPYSNLPILRMRISYTLQTVG